MGNLRMKFYKEKITKNMRFEIFKLEILMNIFFMLISF